MGDPRKQKKKWHGPTHPWQAQRILDEKKLLKEFGLKNKKEIWRAQALFKDWQARARRVISLTGAQKDSEQSILISKMQKLGVLLTNTTIDNVLLLTLRDVLEHRLQTKVYKAGLAITQNQARQFVTHRKITVNGNLISSPSYFVKATDAIGYRAGFTPKIIAKVEKKVEPPQEVENDK